jgi:HEAT repeat protein
MTPVAQATGSPLERARARIRRAGLRRHLEAVAGGKVAHASVPYDDTLVDPATVIEGVARRLAPDGLPLQRLVAELVNSGTVDAMIDDFDSASAQRRAAAVRALGALRMYDVVPWVAPMLAAPEPNVRDAAAHVLGKIGGAASAAALLGAIQRRGMNRRLVAELARSAPDQFIEPAMAQPLKSGTRPALALASGLRRRRTAVGALTTLLSSGSRRERAISCRALGWIGAAGAAPAIAEALNDRHWRIRMSAAKALGALRADCATDRLRDLELDRNIRVQAAARNALRRIAPDGGASRGGDGA